MCEGGKQCVPPAARKAPENEAREVERERGGREQKPCLERPVSLPELPGSWNWDLGCLPATRTPARFPLSPLLPAGGQGLRPALCPLQGLSRTPRAGAPLLPH